MSRTLWSGLPDAFTARCRNIAVVLMDHLPPPDLSLLLPRRTYWQLVHELQFYLPPAIDGTPEARAHAVTRGIELDRQWINCNAAGGQRTGAMIDMAMPVRVTTRVAEGKAVR